MNPPPATQPSRRSGLIFAWTAATLFLLIASAWAEAAGEANAQRESTEQTAALPTTVNPFEKFIGEWTLQGDDWTQNWGNGTEHIKIPGHHTRCEALNTPNTLLAVIGGPPPHGHIVWTYNRATREVHHLSSFAPARSGVGKGSMNENGDVSLKVSFEGEPPGTYRLYSYRWISADAYELKSVQYDSEGKPTGGFYGGTFVRIRKP
jgi:hypothetical protein